MNIIFTSYNGVACIYTVRDALKLSRYGTFLAIEASTKIRKCEIMVNNINFHETALVKTIDWLFTQRIINTILTVKNCSFDFSKSGSQRVPNSNNWFHQNLITLKSPYSSITMKDCVIKANYQIGVWSFWVGRGCLEFTLTKIVLKNTKIEDARYTVYAMMKDCTDIPGKKSFKLYIVNSLVSSRGKHRSRTPQISVVVGKLYKYKIWLSIYMKNSRFENLSVLTNTAAVMDVRGPSVVSIRNCTFRGNIGNRGGALAFRSSFLKIVDSTFYDNQARVIALCAHLDQGGCGGAIFAVGLVGPTEMKIYNSSFIDNMAVCFGSAVYLGYFKTILAKDTHISTRITSSFDTLWYSYCENLRIDQVSFEAKEESTSDGRLFFTRSKALSFGERAPSFKCPVGSAINISESSTGISGKGKSTEVRCQFCPKGTYTLAPSALHGINGTNSKQRSLQPHCYSCSFGSSCQHRIKPKPNFWGYVHKGKAFMVVCPPSYCCQTLNQCTALNSCNSKRTGRLCGKCKHGYFQSMFSNDCLEEKICKTGKFWAVAILMCLLFTVLFTFLQDIFLVILKWLNLKTLVSVIRRGFFWLKDKPSFTKNDGHELRQGSVNEERCRNINNECSEESEGEGVERDHNAEMIYMIDSKTKPNNKSITAGLIKIVFFFYQIFSILTVYKTNRETQYVRDFKLSILSIFNLNAQVPLRIEFDCPLHGMGSITKVWIKALFPVNCLILAGSLYASIYALSHCFSRSKFIQKCSTKVKPRLLIAILQLILLGYSTLTSSILSLVSCVSLINGDKILVIDGNVPCYQPWQYAILMFIALWAMPLIYALYKLPSIMSSGEIAIRGVYTTLLLPLPFAIYTMVRDVRKLRGPASGKIFKEQHLSSDIPTTQREDVPNEVSQLLNVIEGPFRCKASGEKRGKLSWEPILLLQRIILSLCHTFVLKPGTKSLLLLLLIIIFSYMNAHYRPFDSGFLNALNGITFILLCITGIINAIYAFLYEYGSVPNGPLVQILDIFDYLDVAMIMIFPVIALTILVVLVVAKFAFLSGSLISFLIAKCKYGGCRDE